MKVIGERIGDGRWKYFSDAAKTQNDFAGAQLARRSRADSPARRAVLLNILRDDRDSTVNRATARRQDLAASKVITRSLTKNPRERPNVSCPRRFSRSPYENRTKL